MQMLKMDQPLINGEAATEISVTDRGLLYGDGLFETIAVVAGQAPLWSYHMQRLGAGCRSLGISPPDESLLFKEVGSLIKGLDRGVIKIIITRGCGGRGYRPSAEPQPNRIITLHPWPDYPAAWFKEGVVLRLCNIRLGSNSALAGIKHLNRLEQVLARREWSDPNIYEGLMLDGDERVIEATQSNVFLLQDGLIVTPDLSDSGVAGIARRLVIESAKALNIPLTINAVTLQQLRDADALFLTNAITGILPVKLFEERKYDPSLIPRKLIQRLNKQRHGDKLSG